LPRLYRDVLVWDASRAHAERSDVLVAGGKIASVSFSGSRSDYDCSVYEGRGNTAMLPGFVNAHGHTAMTLLRGLGEDLPLMDWLEKRIWPVENKLDADLVYTGSRLAITEMLSTGTTCFADMYFFMDRVAEAALEAGIRCGLSRGIVLDDDGAKLEENLKLARDYNGAGGLVRVQLGPHAPYTVSMDRMTAIADAAIENDLGVQLHWLETSSEWGTSGLEGRMSPEEYLVNTGLIDVKSLALGHGVWIDKKSAPFYARQNVTVVHNPKSNLKLGSGVAPVAHMVSSGVSVALGTDGAASNNRLDMWDEMRFAVLLQKGVNCDPTLLSPQEALRMSTVAGARALGFTQTGLIKEEYDADFMLVDLNRPHYAGLNEENLPGYIVYAGSSADIKATAVAGEILYENGSFTAIDRDDVMAAALLARKKLIS